MCFNKDKHQDSAVYDTDDYHRPMAWLRSRYTTISENLKYGQMSSMAQVGSK